MDAGTYTGLTSVSPPGGSSHLGGNVKEGDPFTFCPNVWNYVIDRFSVRSVSDLGSGIGHAARYFFEKGLQTVAIKGLAENVQGAFYPTICHDLTKGPVVTRVDRVHCQEVAEHLAEEYVDNLIASLGCGRVILMTHALPDQVGRHHVNLKPMDYWVQRVSSRGYNLLHEDTTCIRALAIQERAFFMHNLDFYFTESNAARICYN